MLPFLALPVLTPYLQRLDCRAGVGFLKSSTFTAAVCSLDAAEVLNTVKARHEWCHAAAGRTALPIKSKLVWGEPNHAAARTSSAATGRHSRYPFNPPHKTPHCL